VRVTRAYRFGAHHVTSTVGVQLSLGTLLTDVETLREIFSPIDGLVNNAGVSFEGVLSMMRTSQIERLVRVNTSLPCHPHQVRSSINDGRWHAERIVNVASIIGSGYKGPAVYGATKAPMPGFTRSFTRDVGPLGINVNSVAPGFIDTEKTQRLKDEQRQEIIRRSAPGPLAQIDDGANAVGFLPSDMAGKITGTVLTVDAGNTA
jgi:3-oxoacyl-[acyl-carrier protein] reductase